ncbi:MAG: DMT family transporter [Acetobacteraceae bacterium]|nr:DMT family transporter [Acetobacteraceae bacterium]
MTAPGGRSIARVVAWMGGALVCFSGMAVAIRELAPVLGVFEMLTLRSLGSLAMLGGWIALGFGRLGPPRPLGLHLGRNLIHLGGQASWTYGLTLLPLATVFALEFTAPAWVTLLAVVFLGERATPGRIGGLALGFLGVLVVLRPGAESFAPEALVVLGSALCFATALIFTKAMTARMDNVTLLVWMQVIQLPLILLGHVVVTGGALPLARLAEAAPAMVALLCLTGLLAQVSIASAFRHGDAITVVPLDFLRIPLIAAVGALLYAEPFDGYVLLGAVITAAGILWTLREAARGPSAPTRSAPPR